MSDIQYAKDKDGQSWIIETLGDDKQLIVLHQYRSGNWRRVVSGFKSDIEPEMRRLGLDTDKWYNHQQ